MDEDDPYLLDPVFLLVLARCKEKVFPLSGVRGWMGVEYPGYEGLNIEITMV